VHTQGIASLEEELARLKRGKKRKAVSNPNRRFITLGETLAVGEAIPEGETQNESVVVESVCSDERELESEASSGIEVREEAVPTNGPRGQDSLSKDLNSNRDSCSLL
jgi:hypothetical protein